MLSHFAMKQRIKVITFDITHTLLQFKSKPWDVYAEVAKTQGFKGTGQDIRGQLLEGVKVMSEKHENFGRKDISWKEWWRQVVHMTFKGHLPTSSIDIVANTLIEDFTTSKCWKVTSGGEELVKMLGVQGFCIGVISNFDPRLVTILKNLKLYDNFDFIITSYAIGCMKPDKKIFDHALNEAKEIYQGNLNPDQCLHVGDDPKRDYYGARSAGWHARLLVSSGEVNKQSDPQFCVPKEHTYKSLHHLHLAIEKDEVFI